MICYGSAPFHLGHDEWSNLTAIFFLREDLRDSLLILKNYFMLSFHVMGLLDLGHAAYVLWYVSWLSKFGDAKSILGLETGVVK